MFLFPLRRTDMHKSPGHSLLRFIFGAGIFAVVLALGACASPPVQTMSNARQAIAVAEQAGAAHYAPSRLAAAKQWLDDAESSLKNGNYSRAHSSALQAEKWARRAVEKSRAIHPPPPPASGAGPQLAPVPASGEPAIPDSMSRAAD